MNSEQTNTVAAQKTATTIAVNDWFIHRYYGNKDVNIGAMSLDDIFNNIMALEEVQRYINNVSHNSAKQARFWIIRTLISQHLRYYINTKELE